MHLLKDIFMLIDDDNDKILYPYEFHDLLHEIEHQLEKKDDGGQCA